MHKNRVQMSLVLWDILYQSTFELKKKYIEGGLKHKSVFINNN